jgi:hypothetical protein
MVKLCLIAAGNLFKMKESAIEDMPESILLLLSESIVSRVLATILRELHTDAKAFSDRRKPTQ